MFDILNISQTSGLGSTYCTAYHRLVTGEQEIFCDQINYQVGLPVSIIYLSLEKVFTST